MCLTSNASVIRLSSFVRLNQDAEVIIESSPIIKPIDSRLLHLFFQRAVSFQRKSVMELIEIRKPLEVQSAILASERYTPKDLIKMEQIVIAMTQNLHNLGREEDSHSNSQYGKKSRGGASSDAEQVLQTPFASEDAHSSQSK